MEQHYYPSDVAAVLMEKWPNTCAQLPPQEQLTQLISMAYQASLLSEEGRSVKCHLIYSSPEVINEGREAMNQPLLLALSPPRVCNEQELRRLSPIAHRGTNVLLINRADNDFWQIWGIMQVDSLWNQGFGSEIQAEEVIPNALRLYVRGPGIIIFFCGNLRVLTLQNGHVEGHGFLQFPVAWAQGHSLEGLPQIFGFHPRDASETDDRINELIGEITLYLLRRSIMRVREAGNGGMMVIIPHQSAEVLLGQGGFLLPKYRVHMPPAGKRLKDLLTAVIHLLEKHDALSWRGYLTVSDPELRRLKERLVCYADQIADFMAVDGALVLNKSLDVLGFGVEIRVPTAETNMVYQALNMEGTAVRAVPMDSGGTRHRAAYRLCFKSPDCLAVVVSQDGSIHFVCQKEEKVIFWNQISL